ncbi:MAG TPA: 6-hydroxycyclohex-1-ene-1-carbonyl-CoA dehydrogenase [Vicinamibacteria bacterium]|nr:6-hydroxycyclohex-1-ene-1-carbonyl-CoA dehydrogenase [Vicinamibacteria bacterium]
MRITSWVFEAPGKPMVPLERDVQPGRGEVLVQVAGCGVCHTDLGFVYGGVRTRHPLPLCLGHEVSGRVVEAGTDAESWLSKDVIVPAVIPCGRCAACKAGRASVCPHQVFPGNDVHGGFATHLAVPARGLCRVPDLLDPGKNPSGADLQSLSVIADAVSTPYQAVRQSGLGEGDLAVFVGVGGVGGFGVQIAKAFGAEVVAVDVDDERLDALSRYGASVTIGSAAIEANEVKNRVRAFAGEHDIPSWRWRIFETSGSPSGQMTAYSLLVPGSYLGVVGYTPEKIELRLSNLMAFDATARGNWGCPPEHYPEVLELVLSGRVAVEPFVDKRPLGTINETFEALEAHELKTRPVLVPEV